PRLPRNLPCSQDIHSEHQRSVRPAGLARSGLCRLRPAEAVALGRCAGPFLHGGLGEVGGEGSRNGYDDHSIALIRSWSKCNAMLYAHLYYTCGTLVCRCQPRSLAFEFPTNSVTALREPPSISRRARIGSSTRRWTSTFEKSIGIRSRSRRS